MSYQMTPTQFKPIKMELLDTARTKLAHSFIETVKNTNPPFTTNNTDFDNIRQEVNVRLKRKTRPFAIWCEFLDPIHKSAWQTVDIQIGNIF